MVAPTDSRLVSLTDGPFLATEDMDFATYFPVWPVDDPPGGPLLSARLGCSVDHAQDLLFAGDNEWQRSYHGFRGHSNVRKSPWAKENQ